MYNFSFNHIAISVTDVDISLAFYQKVLQLKEIKNTASNSKTRWLQLTPTIQLHLIPRPKLLVKTNKAIHFALAVLDLNLFMHHLNELSIEYSDWKDTIKKDYVRKDGIKQIYFQDPDGYWIEINEAIS